MQAIYKNEGGLLVKEGTNECAGYILNFEGHGAYGPTGIVKVDGSAPTQADIDAHNAILGQAEVDAMVKHGKGTFYLSYSTPKCTPQNPRWIMERNGEWYYKDFSVSTWAGTFKAKWVHAEKFYAAAFGGPIIAFHVWFTGPDGKKWYGVNKGDMQCFTGRRLKKQN